MKTAVADTINLGEEFLKELESEIRATRRCLEEISENLYSYKPHHRSMDMGYLALLVADIPRWIADMIERSVIDLAHYSNFKLSTTEALLNYFDQNIEGARRALQNVSNEDLHDMFYLKNNGQVLYTTNKKESVQQTINHWVHHRGQLTVYMRMNDLKVPSIYGPSADERNF